MASVQPFPACPRLPSLLIWGLLSMFLVLVVPRVLCICCLLPVAWFVWLLLPVGMTQCVTGGKLGRAWLHRCLPSAASAAPWHRCLRGFCFPWRFPSADAAGGGSRRNAAEPRALPTLLWLPLTGPFPPRQAFAALPCADAATSACTCHHWRGCPVGSSLYKCIEVNKTGGAVGRRAPHVS